MAKKGPSDDRSNSMNDKTQQGISNLRNQINLQDKLVKSEQRKLSALRTRLKKAMED